MLKLPLSAALADDKIPFIFRIQHVEVTHPLAQVVLT